VSAATGSRRENPLLALLRVPVFRRVWAAITFSSLGDWLGLLANTALAHQLAHSRAEQGVAIFGVILVRLAPDLFFGPFAAAIADKFDRRKTVIIGETAAALLYASIVIGYNLVWLYIAQFVIEAVGLFTQPAKQVIWVSIVPKKLLATANQMSLISVYGTAPVASGVFALLSAGNRLLDGTRAADPSKVNYAIVIALLLNAVSFLVSATTIFLSRRQIPAVPADREKEQGILTLLREGVSFVRGNPLIRGLYVGIIGAFAAGGLTVGVAQLWVNTLDAGDAGYAIMFGTVFTGLAVGMLVGPRILPALTRGRVFGLAIGGAGVTLLVASLIRDFILATGLTALIGLFSGIAWIVGYTMIGHEVEDRLRGRIFAFVLSSVRLMLLLTIAVGSVLAGVLGSHSIKAGDESRLYLSGPGLTLMIGGVVAVGVSLYVQSRAVRGRVRLRDLVRRRVIRSGLRGRPEQEGLFVTVDGLDPALTSAYAALVVTALRERGLDVTATGEPTDSPTGRRVRELLGTDEVEPETAALLSAADRTEHVATLVRPELDRGAAVVCDRYVLTSLALHGGGRGVDVDSVRDINDWSTGDLRPDLTLVVPSAAGAVGEGELDLAAADATFEDAIDADPGRYLRCPAVAPEQLPADVRARLDRLVRARSRLARGSADVAEGTATPAR
jgi:dTMP kinase